MAVRWWGSALAALLAAGCTEEEPGFRSPRFSPDGTLVVFSYRTRIGEDNCEDIYVMNQDGTGVRRLTNSKFNEGCKQPCFSPDGNSIGYSGSLEGQIWQIYLMDTDGGNRRTITQSHRASTGPSFSPDGWKICFLRPETYRRTLVGGWAWDDLDVHIINVDGSGERRITPQKYRGARNPSYSIDGKTIVFSAAGEIYILNSNGEGEPWRLTTGKEANSINSDPSFSPNGDRIAFVSNRVSRPSPYDFEVWVMNVDGTEARQITRNQSKNSYPVFSPDGKRIVFCSDQGRMGPCELWRVNVDGSHLELIRKDIPPEAGR
jgi:TolB protein